MTTTWEDIQAELERDVGVTLFTVLAYSPDGARMNRIHSSHPKAYPVGDSKTVATDVSPEWIAATRDSGGTFFGATAADIGRVFGDADLIRSLGCGAIINVPLLNAEGEQWGTANLLAPEGTFDAASVARAEVIAAKASSEMQNPMEESR